MDFARHVSKGKSAIVVYITVWNLKSITLNTCHKHGSVGVITCIIIVKICVSSCELLKLVFKVNVTAITVLSSCVRRTNGILLPCMNKSVDFAVWCHPRDALERTASDSLILWQTKSWLTVGFFCLVIDVASHTFFNLHYFAETVEEVIRDTPKLQIALRERWKEHFRT